ncbi:bifunctional DNA-formamidopyrimidine glycosylase/DNA-(apurinic or apyrimidinic site) lyase [Planctomycetota bacterium]|nr:bifunctional DNA-formamidopyrimidine glycosylase/DNA-(apurinic or apyrimidinic site) lyase [Planctomycetota bacterium]
MPELPEVENVVRSLTTLTRGKIISRIQLHRPDMLKHPPRSHDHSPLKLQDLCNHTITRIIRHGKQFAFLLSPTPSSPNHKTTSSQQGGILAAHLGMTGQFKLHPPNTPLPTHTHLTLELQNPDSPHSQSSTASPEDPPTTIIFRDPRRFGQLRLHANLQDLHAHHWDALGPDALLIEPSDLYHRLKRTTRHLKAALLDQHLVAGLGNIYVDELLYASHISPKKRADRVTQSQSEILVQNMQTILQQAIDAGGSTLRDYVNGHGEIGDYQLAHQVYGKPKNHPCPNCQKPLRHAVIAGRTTVYCTSCQQR